MTCARMRSSWGSRNPCASAQVKIYLRTVSVAVRVPGRQRSRGYGHIGRPDLFTGRVFTFDRNFPGHKIITAILDAGGHVAARAKSDLALPLTPGGWLADGSRLSWLNAPSGKPGGRLPVLYRSNIELRSLPLGFTSPRRALSR